MYIVIVDALATGIFLAPAFKKLGYHCIHVLISTRIISSMLNKLDLADFEISLNAEDYPDQKAIIKFLSQYSIECIIPGADSGVII